MVGDRSIDAPLGGGGQRLLGPVTGEVECCLEQGILERGGKSRRPRP
jgi:hypothetical protein